MSAEGWAWPPNAAKAHYFRECVSLCSRWLYGGKNYEGDFPSGTSPDQCKLCEKKRIKERQDA